MRIQRTVIILLCTFLGSNHAAEPTDTNYEEAQVPTYVLPNPLVDLAGEPITSRQAWFAKRRPEIMCMFEDAIYGRRPGQPLPNIPYTLRDVEKSALDRLATLVGCVAIKRSASSIIARLKEREESIVTGGRSK